jgi:hypothetical protein
LDGLMVSYRANSELLYTSGDDSSRDTIKVVFDFSICLSYGVVLGLTSYHCGDGA